jgi:hypothetical protein
MESEIIANFGEPMRRMDPRMIFSPDLSTLYVSVPKTGTTTIKTVVAACVGLLDSQSVSRGGRVQIHRALRRREGRWSDLADEERREMLCGESTFRFTSVRNPYERVVSCYLNKIADGYADFYLARQLRQHGEVTLLSFLKFVADQSPIKRDVHCRAMVDLCYHDHVSYDDIVRYESFEGDIRRILEKLNVTNITIPKAGSANRTDAGLYLDELLGIDECALIREIYQRDFEAFDYSQYHAVNTTKVALRLARRAAPEGAHASPAHVSSSPLAATSGAGPGAFLAAFRARLGSMARRAAIAKIFAASSIGWVLVGLMALASAICFVVHPEPGVAMGIMAAVAIAMTLSTPSDGAKVSVIVLSALLFLLEVRAISEDRSAQQAQARTQIQRLIESSKPKT